jgi:hypothetical protein
MPLFRDEAPLLGPNVAIDEGYGIETSVGSKILGSFEELLFQQMQQSAPAAGTVIGFIAPYAVELIGGAYIYGVTSSSGTFQLTHDTGVVAPGAGTALLTTTANIALTANTILYFGSPSYAGAAGLAFASPVTSAKVQLAKGDRISVTFGGTLTGLANMTIMGLFKRI